MEVPGVGLRLHHRRRSQSNRRPPPAPVRLVVRRGPVLCLDVAALHDAPLDAIRTVTTRVAKCLFRGFDRWAAVVHRATPPTTVPQAAACLGVLRRPLTPLALGVTFNQANAFDLGPGLRLNGAKLTPQELRDLRWLAHAVRAWPETQAAIPGARDHFACNDALRQAHADMVRRDGDRWGDLVPVALRPMIAYGCNRRANHHQH